MKIPESTLKNWCPNAINTDELEVAWRTIFGKLLKLYITKCVTLSNLKKNWSISVSDSAVKSISLGFEMHDIYRLTCSNWFFPLHHQQPSWQSWKHTEILSKTEMHLRGGNVFAGWFSRFDGFCIDCVQGSENHAIVLRCGNVRWYLLTFEWKVFEIMSRVCPLYVFLLDSRSETELHLWSLQRHTELGGTVSCTPAGLKAPKQVSGSCYPSMQQQS